MKVVFDTSFLQSYLNTKDTNFKNSRTLFRKLPANTEFIIPIIVIGELLCGTEDENVVIKFIEKITNGKYELVNKDDINFLKTINRDLRRSLKSNDCFILSVCRRHDAKLLTFDKKLQKAYDKIFSVNDL